MREATSARSVYADDRGELKSSCSENSTQYSEIEKESLGAAATATKAHEKGKADQPQRHDNMIPVERTITLFAKSTHIRIARAFAYALTLGTLKAWCILLPLLMIRLTEHERASLAFIALKSLNPEQAVKVADAAINSEVSHNVRTSQ